jgi:hypothetical protein
LYIKSKQAILLYLLHKEQKPRAMQEKFNHSTVIKGTEAHIYQAHMLYLFLCTYKEVLLLFCDNTEFGVAESPVEVDADPRKLPVPEISCQL